MNVAISLRMGTEDWERGRAYVVEAERLGAHSVSTPEAWGHDAVAPLAFLAARTSRILLGTAIMQAGTRTPALIAMTALSLASMSHGRFRLGLGVSGPQVIEGWHGIRFDRPVRRLSETIEIVRRATRGERLEYKGEVYQLPLPGGEGKALRVGATPRPDIPVYLATLSPQPRDDGRGGRRLARHVLHARARSRVPGPPGCRRQARRALARRARPARLGRRRRALRRRRAARPAAQARAGVQSRRRGLAPAQLLQRRLPARGLRGRRRRGPAAGARRPARRGDGARARRAGAQDQPARHRGDGARTAGPLPPRGNHDDSRGAGR